MNLFFSCCGTDDVLNTKTKLDTVLEKGDDLVVDKEIPLAEGPTTLDSLVGFYPADWGFTNEMQRIIEFEGPRWVKIVKSDPDLKSFKDNPIKHYLLKEQARYLGQVDKKNSKRMEGVGLYLDREGNYYMSIFESGFMSRYTLAVYRNGDWFLGEMQSNKKLYGIQYSNEQRRKYDGSFENNIPEGVGMLKFEDGRQYKGQFIKGKPHGKGHFSWKNGNTYEGEFFEGKQHGVGNLYIASSGKTFVTKWANGEMLTS